MKRSPMPARTVPMRRCPLDRRSSPIRRSAELAGAPVKIRTKRNDDPAFRAARGLAFRRSGGLCVVCGCSAQHGHHRLRRSQGGPNVEANILPVCAACHGKIHNEWMVRTPDDRRLHRPALAFRMGWLIRGEDRARPLVPWWEWRA